MKNRRDKPNAFLQLDLPDFVETQGYIILTERGQPLHVEKYREPVDERVLELERTLRQQLGGEALYLNETNIRKVYALKVDSLLAFLRNLFGPESLPDYQDIVQRQFNPVWPRGGGATVCGGSD